MDACAPRRTGLLVLRTLSLPIIIAVAADGACRDHDCGRGCKPASGAGCRAARRCAAARGGRTICRLVQVAAKAGRTGDHDPIVGHASRTQNRPAGRHSPSHTCLWCCFCGPRRHRGGQLETRRHQVRISVEWSGRRHRSAGFDQHLSGSILIVAGPTDRSADARQRQANHIDPLVYREYLAQRAGQPGLLRVGGAGPYTLTDNFLEAASENVMFGGADSRSLRPGALRYSCGRK